MNNCYFNFQFQYLIVKDSFSQTIVNKDIKNHFTTFFAFLFFLFMIFHSSYGLRIERKTKKKAVPAIKSAIPEICVPNDVGCNGLFGAWAITEVLITEVGSGTTVISNNTGTTCTSAGYEVFKIIGNVTQGKTYNYSISSGWPGESMGYRPDLGIWIDYNNDKDFDDPGEEIMVSDYSFASDAMGISIPKTGSFTIPNTAVLENVRIRIGLFGSENLYENIPCGIFGAEVEDYTLNITAPLCPAITFISTPTNVICNGESNGKITISSISGGSSPYQISLNNGMSYVSLPLNGEIAGLAANTYQVKIKDNNDCESVPTTVSVTEPAAITLLAGVSVNPTTCGGNEGSISFSTNLPNGTYTLSYNGYGSPRNVTVSGGAFILSGLSAGVYLNFTITTSAGCTGKNDNNPKTLSDPALPLAPVSGGFIPSTYCPSLTPIQMTNSVNCGSGKTVVWYLSASNGVSVPAPTKTLAASTDYFTSCRDNNTGCESTSRYKLSFTVLPVGATLTNVALTADGTVVKAGQGTVTICDLPGNALQFSPSCGVGEIQLISVDGLDFKETTSTQLVDGQVHNYKIRCQAGLGANACLGPESGIMSLRIYVPPVKPVVSILPVLVCEGGTSQALSSTSSCGTASTIWFDALTNTALVSLPTGTPTVTTSYYAKCQGEGNCLSEASNVVTVSVVLSATPPLILNNRPDEVCVGTQVTLTSNCPVGSTVVWNNVYSNPELVLSWLTSHIETITAKCVFPGGCETPNANKRLIWKILDVTIINIGASQSATKPGIDVPMEAWGGQFVTADGGPTLEESSQTNPTLFYTENVNKGAPRYWTVHVDACKQPLGGSVSYDLLCKPEFGAEVSFNTHENIPPYMMFANRDDFTELYAINNPFFGFYSKNDLGNNAYDAGFPKGLYKMGIRYWAEKGIGVAPAVRKAVGEVLLYKEYWFRIVSKLGINTGAAREGLAVNVENQFAEAAPNPVSHTLTVSVNGVKGQEVQLNLVDISGRTLLNKIVKPETNAHREEIDMSHESIGMYFLQISTAAKSTTLKVLRVVQN